MNAANSDVVAPRLTTLSMVMKRKLPVSNLWMSNNISNLNFMLYIYATKIITPKFKKSSPSDPANYRPIALTCTD